MEINNSFMSELESTETVKTLNIEGEVVGTWESEKVYNELYAENVRLKEIEKALSKFISQYHGDDMFLSTVQIVDGEITLYGDVVNSIEGLIAWSKGREGRWVN